MLTNAQIITILSNRMFGEITDLEEHETIKKVLAAFVGKKLTARVQNKLPEGYKYHTGGVNGPEIHGPERTKPAWGT